MDYRSMLVKLEAIMLEVEGFSMIHLSTSWSPSLDEYGLKPFTAEERKELDKIRDEAMNIIEM